ncbi:MAG: pyridoxamine kinase [Lachnospiraceae bacterium]|nr:pyridoxamine kinase [Lachnospiraceae bacterium]
MTTTYTQKKIAIINDLAGYGKCALTVSIPIISSMRVAACPIPTSVFSNHTGYPSFHFKDLTDEMIPYMEQWKKLNFSFDGIISGYLGSKEQIDIVADFIKDFKKENTCVIIDPIMGDHGKTYSAYTSEMCLKMKELVKYADVLTPNITEACILTDTPYKNSWQRKEIIEIAEKLSSAGPSKVVITGINQKTYITNLCFVRDEEPVFISTHRIGTGRHGTGDIFTSMIASDAVNGVEFKESVRKAAHFIKKCIQHSIDLGVPEPEGVVFEELLYMLNK